MGGRALPADPGRARRRGRDPRVSVIRSAHVVPIVTSCWALGVAAIAFGNFALLVRHDYADWVARARKVSDKAKRRLESEIFAR